MSGRCALGYVIALALFVFYLAPFLDDHREQDRCKFGPITNDDYRRYLAQAKRQLTYFPSLSLDESAFRHKLGNIFDNLSRGETSVYARIAMMHATLRAAGGEYRNINGGMASVYSQPDAMNPNPFALSTSGPTVVGFMYLLDVNRLLIFSPLVRDAWIIGSLTGAPENSRPGAKTETGTLSFIVYAPSLVERPGGYELISRGDCPPVPDAGFSDGFALRTSK